jgi:hypothetical protein
MDDKTGRVTSPRAEDEPDIRTRTPRSRSLIPRTLSPERAASAS